LPEHTIGQRAYWLHNLRLSYRTPDGGVEVATWVRNLTDETYKNFAFNGSTFEETTIYFVGEPRTYGLSFMATF
jgi:iron complex outermembrane receptor protein